MNDLQLHYSELWADEMNLTDEEIIENIKMLKRHIRKSEAIHPSSFGILTENDIVFENYYCQLWFFESMLKARKADKQ